jgi:hypothetical protein
MISTPGFWRGGIYVLMAIGITLDQEQQNAILAVGMSLSGLVHAFEAHVNTKKQENT